MSLGVRPHVVTPPGYVFCRYPEITVTTTFLPQSTVTRIDIQLKERIEQFNPSIDGCAPHHVLSEYLDKSPDCGFMNTD
jgi:hypothetical protein